MDESEKRAVQALDPVTGVWYTGTASVIQSVTDCMTVKFDGFSKKTATAVVHVDNIRSCEEERLLLRNTLVSRLESSRLLAEDPIEFMVDGVKRSAIAKENDPFLAIVKTKENLTVRYEDLLPATCIQSVDAIEVEKKRKATKKPVTLVKKKKATTIATKESSQSASKEEIAELVGNVSPIKVNLTDDQLDKVKKKVENWKDGNSTACTIVELKKINSNLLIMHKHLKDLNATMNNCFSVSGHSTPLASVSGFSSEQSTDDSICESLMQLQPGKCLDKSEELPDPLRISRSSDNILPVSSDTSVPSASNAYNNNISNAHIQQKPITVPTSMSNYNLAAMQSATISPTGVRLPSCPNIIGANINSSNSNSGSVTTTENNAVSVHTTGNSRYSHIPSDAQVNDQVLSNLAQDLDCSFLDLLSDSDTSETRSSQYGHVATDSVLCLNPSTDGRITTGEIFLDPSIVTDIMIKSKFSKTAFASRMTMALFSIEEIRGRNVNGLQNRLKLNENKMQYLKDQLFSHFLTSASTRESVWQKEIVKAIDRTNRQRLMKLVKQ